MGNVPVPNPWADAEGGAGNGRLRRPVKVWHPEEMNPAFAAAVNSGDVENLLALY